MLARAALSGLISIVALSVAPAHSQPSGAGSRDYCRLLHSQVAALHAVSFPPTARSQLPPQLPLYLRRLNRIRLRHYRSRRLRPLRARRRPPGLCGPDGKSRPPRHAPPPSSRPAIAAQPPRPSPGARQQRKHPLRNDKVRSASKCAPTVWARSQRMSPGKPAVVRRVRGQQRSG